MAYKKDDKLRFLEILQNKNYNVSKACKEFGCDRTTYRDWKKKEPWFEQAIDDMKEADIDDAEETLRILRKGIPQKDASGKVIGWLVAPVPAATIFFLKTKGKSRGYIETTEIVTPKDISDTTRVIELVPNDEDQDTKAS